MFTRLVKRIYSAFQTIITSENLNAIQDSIIELQEKAAERVEDATTGNLAILDNNGNPVDSGITPGSKADKVSNAVNGNFAGLDESGNLTDSGKKVADFATTLTLEMDSATYVLTIKLKNSSGTVLASGTVDLPVESMIVNAQYNASTKKLILSLQNGNTLEVSIADLISGLVPDSRTINSKRLNANIILYASDIALSSTDSTTLKAAVESLGNAKINRDGDTLFEIGVDGTGIYYMEVT